MSLVASKGAIPRLPRRVARELVASLRLLRLFSIARHYNAAKILYDVMTSSLTALLLPLYILFTCSLVLGVAVLEPVAQ